MNSISVDPLTNRIYVLGVNGTSVLHDMTVYSSTLWVIDGSANKVIAEVPIYGYAKVCAVNSETDLIYVSSVWQSITPESQAVGNGTVFVVNGSTNAVVGQLKVRSGDYSIAVDPKANIVYLTNSFPVYVVNGSTNQVVGTIQVTGLEPTAAVDSSTGLLYACRFQQKYNLYSLVVINASEYYTMPNGQEQAVSTNSTIYGNATSGSPTTNAPSPEIIDRIPMSSCGSVAVNSASHIVYVVGGSNFFLVEMLGTEWTPTS
jgi:hypothetical protein